ncbi:type II toxin-antitoxin system RelB family antitoxin [Ignatzschineria cameli]|uniref:type II toxin-antitoxin system RelB family antitoxin n=1 Tax=Ignatzschineria cameli TaxID=2182793 RepID=UPI000D61B391|nr:DUF6290 family protein [Ignatzschineria cameli]PWD85328.1 hypothetical protein DC080_06630 [Ignatzschineria cameli]
MTIVSIRLNREEEKIFREYAAFHGQSLSTLFKNSVIEKMEDELDLKLLKEAIAYNEKHPETYTHDEVKKALGL